MPKCVECENLRVELDNWCIAWEAHVKTVDVDLPCKYFKRKAEADTSSVEILRRDKLGRLRKLESKGEFDVGYLGPRWISQYIVQSLRMVGDMSMAYDLLLKDANPQLRRRLGLENAR